MELTKHQKEKLEDSLKTLKSSKRLLIEGAAGTGKTFMINELIKHFTGKIVCSAPTHKALKVLSGKINKNSHIQFTTIQAALKLKRYINSDGTIYFKPSNNSKDKPLQNIKYLIIDECSMLDKTIVTILEEILNSKSLTLIVVGDRKQINPINESISDIFRMNYPIVTLTEIIRQKSTNPIIELSQDLNIINHKIPKLNDDKSGYLFSSSVDLIINKLAEVNGTDAAKYIAYTNAEVNLINKKVREKIYNNPCKIEKDEILFFNSAYLDGKYNISHEIKVDTVSVKVKNFNVPLKIRKVEKHYETDYEKVQMKYYSINEIVLKKDGVLSHNDTVQDDIIVIHESSEEHFEKLKNNIISKVKSKQLNWHDYYRFIEQFADLSYNHAITAHRSQGSTYGVAIINIGNINICRSDVEKERLLYTAITRASKTVVLYNT